MTEKFIPIDEDKPCLPYEIAFADPSMSPEDIASFVIEESLDQEPVLERSHVLPTHLNTVLSTSQTLQASPRANDTYTQAIEKTERVLELADKATHAQGVFDCASCSINGTCKALTIFKKLDQKSSDDISKLEALHQNIEDLDRIEDLTKLFTIWSKAQRDKDKAEDQGRNRKEIANMVDKQVGFRDKFITKLIQIKTPKERDTAIQAIYNRLGDPGLKSDFARQGFIDGIIAEIVTFEALVGLKDQGRLKDVRLSSSSEDSRGGYDIMITTKRGRQIRLDVKARATPTSKSIRAPYNFIREKIDYRDRQHRIYEISPTTNGSDSISVQKTRILKPDGSEVLSFEQAKLPEGLDSILVRSLKAVVEYEATDRI